MREFPVLQSADALPGNLPVPPSSFVGRDREIAELVVVLREARIVTLTGVGGVGNTRLALQVAAEVLPRFGHGAWLVELARVRDPTLVVEAIAATVGVTSSPGSGLMETLTQFLRPKQLLLVLDNCEHLLDPVVVLVRALEATCPQLVVLATSREGMGIAGERIVALAPLQLPGSGDRDGVLRSDAGRLFVERAVAVKADFAVTDGNASAIAEVVRRLDGIPLALELAAARVPVLSPAQLAQRLDQRFRLLAAASAARSNGTPRYAPRSTGRTIFSQATGNGCWLGFRCSPAGAVSRPSKRSAPATASKRWRCSICSRGWLPVRWCKWTMLRGGTVATGCWRRSVSTRRNNSPPRSAPSCATSIAGFMSTSWRPRLEGCAVRTSWAPTSRAGARQPDDCDGMGDRGR